jgi:aspartyl-tRNA(Asn)/glutamyl-tRNA(Gln) amidotransferase subunit C
MSLTITDVEHIALLARLELTEAEQARFQEQLSAILAYIASLQDLDTTHTPPLASVLSAGAGLRQDEPRPGLERQRLLENAPQVADNQFCVPPVLE